MTRLESLREENAALRSQLEETRVEYERRLELAASEADERVRALVENETKFQRETRIPHAEASARLVGDSAASSSADKANDPFTVNALRAQLESGRERERDLEERLRNVREQSSFFIASRTEEIERFVAELNAFYDTKRRRETAYRAELERMGQLAEQLIVALHQGAVIDADTRGPISEGLSGEDAAAAAAAWMSDPSRLPLWHALRERGAREGDGDDEEEGPESNPTGHLGFVRALRSSEGSSSAAVPPAAAEVDLRRKLAASNRRYRSLRSAYDALARRTQRPTTKRRVKGLSRTTAATSAEKRRVRLLLRRPRTAAK